MNDINALHVTTQDDYVVMDAAAFAQHCAKIDAVFDLVAQLLSAMATNPMMAAMVPPDLQRKLAQGI